MTDVFHTSSVEAQVSAFFNGKHIRLTSLEDPPWVIFRRSQNGSIVEYTGICYEIVNAMRDLYNFSYKVSLPPDESYGAELPNGSWNGMVGMVLRNESDMGIGSFSVTYARKQVVDFTESYHQEPTALLIPPPMEDNRLLACTKPFQILVWMALFSAIIFVLLISWLIIKITNQFHHRSLRGSSNRAASFKLIIQHIQTVYAILVSQSVPKFAFYSWSIALIMAVWCLSCMVLNNAYTGALISFVSVPKVQPLVKSIQELPDSSLNWVVHRGTALESLFMEAEGGIYYVIGNGLRRLPELSVVDAPMDGVAAVVRGKSAYVDGRSYLEQLMKQDYLQSEQCRLTTTKEEFFSVGQAFLVAKGSPLTYFINQKILQMLESGLIEYWKLLHWPSIEKCKDIQSTRRMNGPKRLSLKDLQSSFLLWSIGCILAISIFLVEMLVCNKTH